MQAALLLLSLLPLGGSTVPADTPAAPDTTPAAEAIARFERGIAADVETDGVGSIAAAIVVGDSMVWSGAFGRVSRAEGAPAADPATTLYRVGSLTKPLTAAVLMRLVEDGRIGLDDPVEPHLPELRRVADRRPGQPRITWRHLASHTAGLDREPFASHAGRGPFREWKRKVVAALPSTRAVAGPGEAYRYSNIGYGALGVALERAAARPYERLLQELVLEPTGMRSSFLVVPRPYRHRLAPGYVNVEPDSVDPRVPRAEHRGRGYRVPGEGLYSTAEDMARFLMAMTGALGDSILSDDIRSEMLRPQTPGDPRQGYGLGFQLLDLGPATLAGHGGTVPGYAAYMVFEPESGIGVVILRNYNAGATNLAAEAQRLVLDLAAATGGTAEEGDGYPTASSSTSSAARR